MEDNNTLCTGCLCSGRKLYFIGETGYHQFYSNILNEIPLQEPSLVCIRICWECCSLLRKFQQFKEQVKRNYTELLWNAPQPLPARLTTTEVHNISYPDHVGSLKDDPEKHDGILGNVKMETDDYTEHREPVAFVNDLLVEPDVDLPIKKSKKKGKEKKRSKNKIKVKKKKKTKEVVRPAADQSGVSDSELLLEDSFQEDNIEDSLTEDKIKDERNIEVEVVIEVPSKTVGSQCIIPVLPLSKTLSTPLKPLKALPKTPAELLPEKPQCVECGKTFSSRKTYRYHLNVLHKGNNRYPCPRCGKVYQWKSNLGRHMRTHKAVDAGELYCDTCDKSFASVATYRQHLRISRRHVSENEFSFTCNECGKKFVNKTRLRDHIDWEHLKKIKFRCQLCNKPFKCHTSLYVHLQNVHRNKEKKDNLCHVCGKSYQNAAKLKYHIIALHTGETPYQCSQCSAAFGWYSSLYRHIREVHYKVKSQPKKTKKTKKLDEAPVYMNYHP